MTRLDSFFVYRNIQDDVEKARLNKFYDAIVKADLDTDKLIKYFERINPKDFDLVVEPNWYYKTDCEKRRYNLSGIVQLHIFDKLYIEMCLEEEVEAD